MDIWRYKDYKAFLRTKGKSSRGQISQWAKICQCQVSYISQVLHGKPHLTPDQAYLLSDQLTINRDERKYFLLSVELGRATTPSFRKHIEQEMLDLKNKHHEVSRQVKDRGIGDPLQEAMYYSMWYWAALHLLVSCKGYQTAAALSERLNLPHETIEKTMRQLEEWGLVNKKGQAWAHAGPSIHLRPDSPFLVRHHENWRKRAVDRAHLLGTQNINYTALYSIDEKHKEQIRELCLQLINESRNLAGASPTQDVHCLNIDFFSI